VNTLTLSSPAVPQAPVTLPTTMNSVGCDGDGCVNVGVPAAGAELDVARVAFAINYPQTPLASRGEGPRVRSTVHHAKR